MDNIQFREINQKLDRMSKLLAAVVVQGKTFREQVQLLSDVGFQPSEIAEITGKDANSIRVTKTLMKKKNG